MWLFKIVQIFTGIVGLLVGCRCAGQFWVEHHLLFQEFGRIRNIFVELMMGPAFLGTCPGKDVVDASLCHEMTGCGSQTAVSQLSLPLKIMGSHMNQQATINKLLAETKTIAVVGFSSKTAKADNYVPAYVQEQGYRIIPVNPMLQEGLGETAVASLTDIAEPVDLVLIFQRSENVPPFVDQAIETNAKAVWMQLGIANETAAAKAAAAGLDVVQDACMLVEHKRWAA